MPTLLISTSARTLIILPPLINTREIKISNVRNERGYINTYHLMDDKKVTLNKCFKN